MDAINDKTFFVLIGKFNNGKTNIYHLLQSTFEYEYIEKKDSQAVEA